MPLHLNLDRFDLNDYTRQVLNDGTVTWIHRDMTHRLVMADNGPTKHQHQTIKAARRYAAGKPSYRQRQRSAKASQRKRILVVG